MSSIQADKRITLLGQLVRQYRTRDESQAVFCQRLGVTRKTLSALEDMAKALSSQHYARRWWFWSWMVLLLIWPQT